MQVRKRQQSRALLDAVLCDDINGAEHLLASGADVNARDPEHGETPLMLAHSPALLRLLLDAGANVHTRDNRGRTSFHARPDALLLAAGADINAQDNAGETPLMQAVASADFDRVTWLLANGADAALRDSNGNTALSFAHRYGFSSLTLLLERTAT